MKAFPFFLLMWWSSAFAQDCACLKDFRFVIDYYEQNLPAYDNDIDSSNQDQYDLLKTELLKEAAEVEDKVMCYRLLNYYVEFFRDNHSRIRMDLPIINEERRIPVRRFKRSQLFKQRERYPLTKEMFEDLHPESIEGVYISDDSVYVVAVLSDRTKHRDYVGVILKSSTPLWEQGQVKFELKINDRGSYDCFLYMRNHSLRYYHSYTYEDQVLGDVWFKMSRGSTVNHAMNRYREFAFKKLNDSVSYIRLPSFSGDLTAKINRLYEAADSTIRNTPYLIVDVRNNGGGSDSNVDQLVEYMYTDPIILDSVEFKASRGNIAIWESWYENVKADTVNYSPGEVRWFEQELEKFKSVVPGDYVMRTSGEQVTLDTVLTNPKKIVILQNKFTASSAETLVYYAQQSKKAVIAGEASGGYTGYGDVSNVTTPNYEFTLYCSMMRYKEQLKNEVIGIQPQVQFDYTRDWIEQAIELFK